MNYTVDVFVPPRTPIAGIDRLVDELERIANEVATVGYPYNIDLLAEIRIAQDYESVANFAGRRFKEQPQETIEAYRKLGVQALKIAHILSEFAYQENEK